MNKKKTLQFLAGALFALSVFALFLLASFLDTSHAAVSRSEPVPLTWQAPGGTNAWSINYDAIPVVTWAGTNYTAITTNVHNGTNRFQFIRGVLVNVLAP